MRSLRCLFTSFFISLCLFSSVQAETYYRLIPFAITVNNTDKIIVDYDFSEKIGIRCVSSAPDYRIDFVYKGHQKSVPLPVVLESDHVPEIAGDELADIHGQFTLSPHTDQTQATTHEVICHYVSESESIR